MTSRRRRHALAAPVAAVALSAIAGCATPMAELRGERGHTEWIAGSGGPQVEVPSIFTLHNGTWGTVRVESVRAPVGVDVSTIPPLPAAIGPGKSMEVAVIGRFRRDAGDAQLRVLLESAGQEPLPLTIDARFQPASPAGAPSAPQAISAPAPVVPSPAAK